jgi:hypothetical protein
MVSFTPRPLYPGRVRFLLDRSLDGSYLTPVWMLWSREKSFAPARNRTPAVQPVAIPTPIWKRSKH